MSLASEIVTKGVFPILHRLRQHDLRYRLDSYSKELRKATEGCATLLDLGCGSHSLLTQIGWEYSVGVEGFESAAAEAKKAMTHSEIVCCDLRKIPHLFEPASFDAVVALDVIEHFNKDEGYGILAAMEKLAKKVVIVSTPNGFLSQGADENALQEHLSGWDWREMRELGFRVRGLFGPKFLRAEYHLPRFRPLPLFGLLAEAGDLFYTHNHPRHAAGILCLKNVNSKG